MRGLALLFTLMILSLHLRPALCETSFVEAVKLLEKLGEEGMDVSAHIAALNEALQLYRENRTAEAEELIGQVLNQLRVAEQSLPAYRLQKWLRVGVAVAVLTAIPPLFYYFFPRVYAFAWAISRRKWVVKGGRANGSR